MRVALAGPVRFDELAPHLERPLPDGLAPVPGGSPVTHLALGLARRGHDVHVATLAGGVDRPLVARGDGITVRVGPYRRRHRARDAFRVERAAVRDAVATARPDVVHAHWTYEFALGALASGRPTVVTVRDWAPVILRYHPHPYRLVRLGMAIRTFQRARHLTVTSPYMQQLVRRWARRDASLVPNAIDDGDFTDLDPQAWPRSPQAPRLLAINVGYGPRKNTDTLLRAFPAVRDRHPAATLTLIGDGHGPGGPAEAFAREQDLRDGVELAGRRPYGETMRSLASADVLVHPSREESFGMVLVEAMARGVPVVGGRQSGAVPWVCDGGAAGVLVDVEDPAAVAAGIHSVLTDVPGTRQRLAHAHRRARARFSLSAVLDAYEDVYAQVLGGS